jgi:hypothetical protein
MVDSSAAITLSDVFQFSNTRGVPFEEQHFRLHINENFDQL